MDEPLEAARLSGRRPFDSVVVVCRSYMPLAVLRAAAQAVLKP